MEKITRPIGARADATARLVRLVDITSDGGFAWFGSPLPDVNISSVRMFEDGVELGPANSLHRDIREQGKGRFSWFNGYLRFSASDHTDPRSNGRDYRALVSPVSGALVSEIEAAAVWPTNRPIAERHRLLNQIAQVIYPGFCLPDVGRHIDSDSGFHAVIRRFFDDNAANMIVDRRYGLKELAKLVMDLNGDVAECGCHNGVTAYLLAEVIRQAGVDKKLHVFDSFAGLSEPRQEDGTHWHKGDLAYPLEAVRKNLADFSFLQFHPGWIPETFPEVADRLFVLVHIDVDLYEPTRDSLRFFWDRLVPGGLIVSDDYGFLTCPGATQAIDEFFATRPEPIVNLASGGAFIMKRG
jgi:hypothetical protein